MICSERCVYAGKGAVTTPCNQSFMDAERFNQFDIMASFGFTCRSSNSQAVVACPQKTAEVGSPDFISPHKQAQSDVKLGCMCIGFPLKHLWVFLLETRLPGFTL